MALFAGGGDSLWAINNCRTFTLFVAETLAGFNLTVVLDAFIAKRYTPFAVKRNSLWAVDDCWALALLVAKTLAGSSLSIILDTLIAQSNAPFAV